MYSMALLKETPQTVYDGRELHETIGRTVFSQVGPVMMLSPANVFRGYLMRFVREIMTMGEYTFSPQGEITLAGQMLDRALAAFPIPPDEFRRENPLWPPGKVTPWVGSRHRMDALYARTFSLMNLSDEVLDKFEDFFGPLSIETVSQGIHFAANNSITDDQGRNVYVSNDRLRERFRFPIFSIHGAENGLIDPATLTLMRRALERAGATYLLEQDGTKATTKALSPPEMQKLVKALCRRISEVPRSYLTWLIPEHGHLDCLMGTRTKDIAKVVSDYLCTPDAGNVSRCEDEPVVDVVGSGGRRR